MLYRITATATRNHSGWTTTKQLPTFVLDGDTLGIINHHHARKIARRLLDPFNGPHSVEIGVIEIDPSDALASLLDVDSTSLRSMLDDLDTQGRTERLRRLATRFGDSLAGCDDLDGFGAGCDSLDPDEDDRDLAHYQPSPSTRCVDCGAIVDLDEGSHLDTLVGIVCDRCE